MDTPNVCPHMLTVTVTTNIITSYYIVKLVTTHIEISYNREITILRLF